MRYVHDQFHERMSTLIAEKDKVVTVDGQEVHLKIWDTAGELLTSVMVNCVLVWVSAYILLFHLSVLPVLLSPTNTYAISLQARNDTRALPTGSMQRQRQ